MKKFEDLIKKYSNKETLSECCDIWVQVCSFKYDEEMKRELKCLCGKPIKNIHVLQNIEDLDKDVLILGSNCFKQLTKMYKNENKTLNNLNSKKNKNYYDYIDYNKLIKKFNQFKIFIKCTKCKQVKKKYTNKKCHDCFTITKCLNCKKEFNRKSIENIFCYDCYSKRKIEKKCLLCEKKIKDIYNYCYEHNKLMNEKINIKCDNYGLKKCICGQYHSNIYNNCVKNI